MAHPLAGKPAPRVDARLPLQLTEPDTRLVVTTESLDLSRNGLACRTSQYLAPLSKVAVTVILPPFGNLSRASRSLRAEGVVVREPDPDDGRALRVRYTDRGATSLLHGLRVLADLEREIAKSVGKKRMAELNAILSDVVKALEA